MSDTDTPPVVSHHSNSRRFRCEGCNRVYEWGSWNRPDLWVPKHRVECHCGWVHVRGPLAAGGRDE